MQKLHFKSAKQRWSVVLSMTLRWGIVSAGKISSDFVNAFNTYPDKGDQAIVAVAARNKDKAIEFAKIHKITKMFESYEALAKSNDIDVAYIASLNPDHYEHTKLFLENGKHVLCEKTFTQNYKQSLSLIKLAKKKNLFLMEAVWSRFCPAYLDLEKDISSGKLGDVQHLEANFGVSFLEDRSSKREYVSSALFEIGIYTLQLAQYVFKEEPTRVTAIGSLNEYGVDSTATMILEYSGGRRAVLNTHAKLELWNKATVYGSKGRFTLEQPFHIPQEVTGVDGKLKTFPFHESKLPYNYENSAGLVYQTIEVARCIKEGLLESPRMSHKETLILAKLQDTVRQQLGVHYDADDKEYP